MSQKDTILKGMISRREILYLLGAGCILSSCSHPLNPFAGPFTSSIDAVFNGLPEAPLTRSQIDALPYAAMQSKIGNGGFSLVILANYRADGLQWVSADRVVLITQLGRIMKTAGLPENLGRTQIKTTDPLEHPLTCEGKELQRFIDIPERQRFNVLVKSRFRVGAAEEIEILEKRYTVRRIEEVNEAPVLDWNFTNLYWADSDIGFIWRSEQHTTPDTPAFVMNILKPPAPASI